MLLTLKVPIWEIFLGELDQTAAFIIISVFGIRTQSLVLINRSIHLKEYSVVTCSANIIP